MERIYIFIVINEKQIDIQFVKKFDDWEYFDNVIEKRMLWIFGVRFIILRDVYFIWWGIIIGKKWFDNCSGMYGN